MRRSVHGPAMAAAMVLAGASAGAQSLTAAEIRAQVDQRMASLDEYATLLNDPDPRRARAAMQIMLGSGDPDLERMALDYGLFSTDLTVRRVAVETWLRTEPAVAFRFPVGKDRVEEVRRYMTRFNGTVSADGIGSTSYVVGAHDDARNCYIWKDYPQYCAFSLSDEAYLVNFFDNWSELTLSEDGKLRGEIILHSNIAPVPVEIPVSR